MVPSAKPKADYHEIACQQILAGDRSVFSIQWIDIVDPTPRITSDTLLEGYLRHIERCTLSLVRPHLSSDGLEFRLGGSSLALIRFMPPDHEWTANGSRTTMRICGGILVQPKECDRGELDFIVEPLGSGTRLILQLSDYCPLLLGDSTPSPWRRWLYRLTQAYLHKVVTVRFLARTYNQLTGLKPKTRVVRVAVRTGDET